MRKDLRLTDEEQQMLAGEHGEAIAMAMRIITALAQAAGAERLRAVEGAHVDGGLYHGPVGLEFAERLAAGGGHVAVPTTMNVSSLDLLHPELVRLDAPTRDRARQLMDTYVSLGCQATWTCAPYQLPGRPALGQHIAWGESNAIVFANSVLGARTGRYGDFTDICAALAGRVPDAGLHRDENRRAQVVYRFDWLGDDPTAVDELYGLIGYAIGEDAGSLVPAIVGLPVRTTEDQLKALGAGAASSGSVAMFHAVGLTPEAPTLDVALHAQEPDREVEVFPGQIKRARDALSTAGQRRALHAVSVGTPHFSVAQLRYLAELMDGRVVHRDVTMYAATNRHALAAAQEDGTSDRLEAAGIRVVVDTCTYVTPILESWPGTTVMTDSAKWAWYAPANLGVDVIYGSLPDCVESAIRGSVVRTPHPLLDG